VSAVRIPGWLYGAGVSARAEAAIVGRAGSLVLEAAGGEETLDPARLILSDAIAGVPVRIEFADGRAFEGREPASADQLAALLPRPSRLHWLHRIENARLRVLAPILAACLASLVAFVVSIPYLADRAAGLVPADVERELGAAVLDNLDRLAFSRTTLHATMRNPADAQFRRLAEAAPAGARSATLTFRNAGRVANAMALPGGIVVLTDELVRTLPVDEIAAVLAHELGHVAERHVTRQIFRSTVVAALISVIAGDAGGLVGSAAGIAALLTEMSFSRAFENDADAFAHRLLTSAGYRPESLADALERLDRLCGKDCGKSSFGSTHPATPERIARLRALAR
jgi:Zn-dependent protease with chaperone function